VRIVNRVEHQVLVVPAESCKTHADVQPGQVDAVNVCLPRELHQTVHVGGDVVQIPWMIQILELLWMNYLLMFVAKARPKLTGGHVGGIFNLSVISNLIVNHLPEIVLNLLVVSVSTLVPARWLGFLLVVCS